MTKLEQQQAAVKKMVAEAARDLPAMQYADEFRREAEAREAARLVLWAAARASGWFAYGEIGASPEAPDAATMRVILRRLINRTEPGGGPREGKHVAALWDAWNALLLVDDTAVEVDAEQRPEVSF